MSYLNLVKLTSIDYVCFIIMYFAQTVHTYEALTVKCTYTDIRISPLKKKSRSLQFELGVQILFGITVCVYTCTSLIHNFPSTLSSMS